LPTVTGRAIVITVSLPDAGDAYVATVKSYQPDFKKKITS
jgi:hypothetical protein